jgi:histidine triad (HIT) family protein
VVTDLTSVPWRTGDRGSGRDTLLFTSGAERDDIPVGRMATPELAEAAASAHNAELLRRLGGVEPHRPARRLPAEEAATESAGRRETAVRQGEEVMDDCPFCRRIERGEYDYFDDYSVAFQPLNPVTPGHFLVVPQVHVTSALEAPEAAGHSAAFSARLAGEMELPAFNLITSSGNAATQTVRHLHWHVVPRREGDGLALPWTGQKDVGSVQSLRLNNDSAVWLDSRTVNYDNPPRSVASGDPKSLRVHVRKGLAVSQKVIATLALLVAAAGLVLQYQQLQVARQQIG